MFGCDVPVFRGIFPGVVVAVVSSCLLVEFLKCQYSFSTSQNCSFADSLLALGAACGVPAQRAVSYVPVAPLQCLCSVCGVPRHLSLCLPRHASLPAVFKRASHSSACYLPSPPRGGVWGRRRRGLWRGAAAVWGRGAAAGLDTARPSATPSATQHDTTRLGAPHRNSNQRVPLQ